MELIADLPLRVERGIVYFDWILDQATSASLPIGRILLYEWALIAIMGASRQKLNGT